ncbi:sugar ABC transporter ATP-binding protein [Kroppenstedtia eburnea]|uniref:Ribose ABC transporter ATP-binding protein n=1 Tax=Kroppenstedtia eburnea TaxID=714067 RepID=A0A1N7LA95_9BACL|nr:sugar ABC transporter ATP-binding protein [Kroppenstedtia eburnea]EGK07417.1 ribose ABC superfamily ATP binding cassette transporter, ABC protein [Desmospora sp. 8437]QKI81449.1 sugar ABC transporter ATP-binding protein [Kroppenstedtia eburnea]SIS70758.1 ribose ABC transporter ATP-binding protein [Kroppenstedtia eburnea]
MTKPLLEMTQIQKSFSGVQVLTDAGFSLDRGEVHALMGENGAGKSTLMKILGGIYRKDGGRVMVSGVERDISNPREATGLGIAMIHQELNLIPHLSVMENLFLGREFVFGRTGWIRWNRMKAEAKKWLEQLEMDLDPSVQTGDLSVGQQQMVEIAKALSLEAKILVLDEPTAALTNREIESLFNVIRSLKKQGVGMIYISHRMEEIFEICDRITVMRDGETVGTRISSETDMNELVRMMVGREIKNRYPRNPVPPGEERLSVEGLTRKGEVKDVTFSIRQGEIVGLAGLMGAGRTETADLLFGIRKPDGGTIRIDGQEVRIRRPEDAIRHGIAYVTEDRKQEGLVLPLSVRENLSLPNLPSLSSWGVIHRQKEARLTEETVKTLSVKTSGPEQEIRTLSGGNQQKVVIGKWLATSPRVLILDEPTRGVDIGAKEEIYRLMDRLAREGLAILLISSDLPEVLGMSDRVLVMHEGRVTGRFEKGEATQENVMRAASGGEV